MLKNFLRYCLEKILLPACGFFTVFIFLIALCLSFGDPESQPGILLSQAMVILLFSLVLAALNRIFFISSLHVFVRLGIHFVATFASLILILFLLSGYYAANGMDSAIFLILFFMILYLLGILVFLIFRGVKRARQKEAAGGKPAK